MVFSSLFFLYLFLPILLLAYFAFRNTSYRNWILILFSFAFYAWGEPVWIILLILASVIGYLFALGIEKYRGTWLAKAQFIVAVAINIGILGFFKYSGFLVDTIHSLLPIQLPHPEVTLPMPRDGALLGHVAHQDHGHAAALGDGHHPRGHFAHLAHGAGRTRKPRRRERLHRVHDAHIGPLGLDRGSHHVEVGLGDHGHRQGILAQPLGPELDLCGRFLTAHVEHARPRRHEIARGTRRTQSRRGRRRAPRRSARARWHSASASSLATAIR